MTKLRGVFAFVVVMGVGTAPIAGAQTADVKGLPSRAECFAAHEKSQSLRNESKLLTARQVLRQCSASSCPSLVTVDCIRWLEDVEKLIPTVVFEAVDGDKDLANVKVTEGDRVLADSITGSPVELEPGAHKLKAETPGRPTQETTYVIREGEKARVIRLNFSTTPPPGLTGTGGPMAEPTGPRPMPASAILLGSVAVAAAGAGAAFGVLALKKRTDLDNQHCKPVCSDSQISPVKSMALFADISFGAAIVSAGIAGILYATRPVVVKDKVEKPAPTTLRPDAFLTPTFAGLGLGGSF